MKFIVSLCVCETNSTCNMFLFLYLHLFFLNVIIATRGFQSQGLKMLRFRVMSGEVHVILSDLETTGRKRLFAFPRLQHANDLWRGEVEDLSTSHRNKMLDLYV